MTAETAYNVIQALPQTELPRLYKMLGVGGVKDELKPVKKSLMSDAKATEFLLKTLKKPCI